MLTERQEENLSNANKKTKKRLQDKADPQVVNINDGRRMPNVAMLREHKDYRVYHGPADATDTEALAWVKGEIRRKVPKVTYTSPIESFDVGKATKDEMIVFAMEELALPLDPDMHIATMRSKVMAAANKLVETQPAEDLS